MKGHVLIRGPTGCGKELAAKAIHRLSSRGREPMLAYLSPACPDGMIDAQLFGHPRNVTGPGQPEEKGLLGEADGSTLFLDEIGDMPLHLQPRLLRVMETGEYHRVKETKARRTDIRIIAATHKPLSSLREDLQGRFSCTMEVPDLNDRREDIPLLMYHLLRTLARERNDLARQYFDKGDPEGWPHVTAKLVKFLLSLEYTKHTRELKTLLEKAAYGSPDWFIDLPPHMAAGPAADRPDSRPPESSPAIPDLPPGQARAAATPPEGDAAILDAYDERVLELFRRHGFNMTECASDPERPGCRQRCDLIYRVLISKALFVSQWEAEEAGRILAGDETFLRVRVNRRVRKTLMNLRLRLEKEEEETLRSSIEREYGTEGKCLLRLLDAIKEGRI